MLASLLQASTLWERLTKGVQSKQKKIVVSYLHMFASLLAGFPPRFEQRENPGES